MKKQLKDTSVLIIEDEPALNEAYLTILKSEKVKVDSCFNGEEALSKLRNFQPDIILLDLKMPNMGGIEFLKLFSEIKPKRKSKVIIFSNYNKQDEIEDAFSLGATKYILKAWATPQEIIKVIEELV